MDFVFHITQAFIFKKKNEVIFFGTATLCVLLALLLYLFVFCTNEAADLLFFWWKTSAFETKAFSKYEEMVEKVNWLGSVSWVSP